MSSADKLRKRLEKAEQDSIRKSELLAHTSHEIRTQLSAVIGMTQLALDTRLTPEQAEFVEIINEAGQSLLTLVNDLLDVSKIEAGRLEIERIPFSVRDTLADVIATYSAVFAEAGLWLKLEYGAHAPDRLLGDPGRLRQIVANLLTNAAKFTDHGGVSVWVDGADDEVVSVAVTDTGVGIPAERQAAVFESYTQVDDSTARTHGGTGLGLAISKRLAQMMGGDLVLTSEVGVGSTFTATVRAQTDSSFDGQVAAVARSELLDLPVLMLGQVSASRRQAMEELGLELTFTAAETGVEDMADSYRRGSPYALVVLGDVPEPLEVAAELRERAESRATHMLVLTSTGTRGDAADCRELQVAGYLTNPYSPEDLATAVREVLAGPAPLDLTLLVTKHWLRERRHRLNVLVVDDSPTIRMSTSRMLERRGHIVVAARSGAEALAAVASRRFDAAVVDLNLPGADGVELVGSLQAASTTGLPVVASTVSSDTGVHDAARQAGCSVVLGRPFEIHDLVHAIEQSVTDVSGA